MKNDRVRVDWMPGGAAQKALRIAEDSLLGLNRQAVIDRLVILGLYALQQSESPRPNFDGMDRDRWRLPPGMDKRINASRENNAEEVPACSRRPGTR